MLKETSNKVDNNNDNNANSNITFIKTVSNAVVTEADHNSRSYALQKPRYTVLVIDMLNDFVYGKLKIEGVEKNNYYCNGYN